MNQKISIFDTAGKQTGTVDVTFEQPTQNVSMAYAVSVRRLLQQWRQGTVSHQTRGMVSLTNKKPWRQKGTGRARAGSARSPLCRGSGVIFGPTARTRTINISRKQRQLALRAAMHSMLSSESVYCLDVSFEQKPSVKTAYNALKAVGIENKKLVVFLSFNDTQSYLSMRNMPNVHVVFYDQINVFDLTNARSWVFLNKDVNLFTDMVAKWN